MVRSTLIGTMFILCAPAWAEPAAATLQIRLQVVDGCAGETARTPRCPVPRQRSDAADLPPQVQALAPPPREGERPAPAEPLTVYY